MSSFATDMAIHNGSSETWAAAALVSTQSSFDGGERWPAHGKRAKSTHGDRTYDGHRGDEFDDEDAEDYEDIGNEEGGSLIGESADVKKKLKRAANRKSAQLSRQRKKKHIEELTQQYSKLKRSAEVLTIISDVVFLLDELGTVLFVSQAAREVLGAEDPSSQIMGKPVYPLLTPASARQLQDVMGQAVLAHRHSMLTRNQEDEASVVSSEQRRLRRQRCPSGEFDKVGGGGEWGASSSSAATGFEGGEGGIPPLPPQPQLTYPLERCTLQFVSLVDNRTLILLDITGTAATVEGSPQNLQFVCSARPRVSERVAAGRSSSKASSSNGSSEGSSHSASSSISSSSSRSGASSSVSRFEKNQAFSSSGREGSGDGSDDGSGSSTSSPRLPTD
eukprot:CAMPEP_0171766866 /NCGR_PEP_ID=MMETSP0991-20121206/51500_1 /TAXON_ID=483369 /ORGANISM="non described non described, Strain CCMP2098" /LENGTH=390 /DNA_ID=CAMNT_0012371589 /DNA_START=67 /DNA_END=1239 /DNA_ORIENTATION=+